MATETTQKLGVLKTRSEFLRVRDGRYAARGAIVIQTRKPATPSDEAIIRFGVTATKKIGNAVIRNRAKRRLREVARTLLPEMGRPGQDYVLIARNGTATRDWTRLLDDTRDALQSVHTSKPGASRSVR